MKKKQDMLIHELATYNAICYVNETEHPTNVMTFLTLLKDEMDSRGQSNYLSLCSKEFVTSCILNKL